MENYGNDMFLSQEAYPSIDFTLLDRASGSHSLESLKHPLRGYLTPNTSKGHGVHDFFEQKNAHQHHLGIRAGPGDGQSLFSLSRNMTVDELSRQSFHNQDNYGKDNCNDVIERPSLEARMAFAPTNVMKAGVTNNLDNRRLVKETPSFPAVQTQVQKQMINAQKLSGPSQNNCYSVPYNNGISSHGAMLGNLNYFDAQHTNQGNAYDAQNSAGVVFNDASRHQFIGNQVPSKGALRPLHVETGHDAQAGSRATRFTQLQSQRQLQQFLLAQQLKQQLEYSGQFQMLPEGHNQVSGTSYSALLHGPDTPPSQHQATEEASMEECSDQLAALPAANSETMGWTVDGASYSQGFPNAPLQQPNQNQLSHLPLLEDPLAAGSHAQYLHYQNGPAVMPYSGAQNVTEDYVTSSLRLPSVPYMGMPILRQPIEVQTMNLGLRFDENIEPRSETFSNANTCAGQSPRCSAEPMIRQKLKGNNSLQQVNVLSQSQQHFQERQLSEQRMWNLLEQQHVRPPIQSFPLQNSDPLPQTNSLVSAKNTLKDGLSYPVNGNRQQLDNTPSRSAAFSEHQQLLLSSAVGPNRHMEEGLRHQYNSWNAMQGFQAREGIPFHPSNASVYGQQGVSKTQGSTADTRAFTSGDGVITSQESMKVRQESGWKEKEGVFVSDHTFQPYSGPVGASQGSWREYAPLNKVPTGVVTSGQLVDLFRPGSDVQPPIYLAPRASSGFTAVQMNPTGASAPHIVGQRVSEEHRLVKEADNPYRQGQLSQNQAGATFMKSLSQEAAKLVPNEAEDAQHLLYKSAELQALSVEKQREVSWQQQLDPSGTSKISLAHLRGSQFSNQSSPQQVKLGLGPSNLSQDLQQNDGASWRALSDMQGMDRQVNRSSPFLQENMILAASSSSTFAYRHGNNSKSIAFTNAMPSSSKYDEGPRPSGNEATREMDVSSSVMQAPNQTSTGSHIQSPHGFLGKHCHSVKAHGQPNHNARGMVAVQSQHSRDFSQELSYDANTIQPQKDAATHPNDDASGIYLMENQHTSNNSLRHFGGRAQAVKLTEPANPSQKSLINQVNGMDINDQPFLGTVESSCLSSGSAHGSQGDANQMMHKQQELMRKPGNRPFVQTHEHMTWLPDVDSQPPSHESRNKLKGNSEAQTGPSNEAAPSMKVMIMAGSSTKDSGLVPNENPQGKRRRLSSPMTGGWPDSVQAERPRQEHHYIKPLSFVPPQTDTPSKASSRLPFQKPPLFVLGHPVQQLHSSRDISRNEDAANEVLTGQTADEQLTLSGKNLRRQSIEQHNAFDREEARQCQMQPLLGSEKDGLAAGLNERSHHNVNIAKNLNSHFFPGDGAVKPSATVDPLGSVLQATKQGHVTPPHSEGIKEEGSLPKEEVEGFTSMPNQRPLHQSSPLLVVISGTETLHAKKRKKQVPSLIPWHVAAAQPRNALPSISDAELMWASATNRLPEKDASGMNQDIKSGTSRATRRLKLTNQLMQRLISPPTSPLIHGNTPTHSECAIYTVSKLNLEDACRLVAHSNAQANMGSNMSTQCQGRDAAMTKCLENFMERVKQSGMELARLDCSKSLSELQGDTHEVEKLSIVNRLAKHHGIGFIMDSSDNLFIENTHESGHGARRLLPQKYVTAAPLPRTLPGVKCLSL